MRLDISWRERAGLGDSANLPDPHVLAQGITKNLRSALEQIEGILEDLQERVEA